jgi:hypothetical protein
MTTINSVCECQARLHAELDERRHVRRGWAQDPTRRAILSAPAHCIDPESESFSIGWSCPFCIRNTLRRFDASMLVWTPPDPAVLAPDTDRSAVE